MPARGRRVIDGVLYSPEEVAELRQRGVDVRHCKQRKDGPKKRSRSPPTVRRRLQLAQEESDEDYVSDTDDEMDLEKLEAEGA